MKVNQNLAEELHFVSSPFGILFQIAFQPAPAKKKNATLRGRKGVPHQDRRVQSALLARELAAPGGLPKE